MAALSPRDVHVWRIDLGRWAPRADAIAGVLSKAERDRAARFALDRLRRTYLAAHARLRAILASYLDGDPASIRFVEGPAGKPEIAAPGDGSLRFNLAHAGDLALLAVARARVGVDVEEAGRTVEDADAIVASRFAPAEAAAWRALPDSDRSAAFVRVWTRKEACLKATGAGIAAGLDSVVVSVGPPPARLVRAAEGGAWTLLDLDVGPSWAAALAVEAEAPTVSILDDGAV